MDVRNHWYEIGIHLGVDLEELSACKECFPRNLAAHLIHVFSLEKTRAESNYCNTPGSMQTSRCLCMHQRKQ